MDFENYDSKYPNLPLEIVLFFSQVRNKGIFGNSIQDFLILYNKKYELDEELDQNTVVLICQKLTAMKVLDDGIIKMGNYWCQLTDEALRTDVQKQVDCNSYLSLRLYGFPYIYNRYRDYVLPVVHTDKNGDKSLGTCFLFQNGIVSAKHCFENARKISIQGVSEDYLKNAIFYVHENEMMDLVYIENKNSVNGSITYAEEAKILDEVMTLGYPNVAGYHNFLTAEHATVSARFTATTGQVCANAKDIWIKENLLLITAKIKGGNSGGPVINKNGSIVGVAVSKSTGEGKYDDLGYGTVIPISHLSDGIVRSPYRVLFNTNNIVFEDFDE